MIIITTIIITNEREELKQKGRHNESRRSEGKRKRRGYKERIEKKQE